MWVVRQRSKAELRPVVTGDWHGNDWFIYEGLQAGDQVVVDGGMTLAAGRPGKANAARPKKPRPTQSDK